MGAKTFRSLDDFGRHGVDIQLSCSHPHCRHWAIADAHDVMAWARLWRWPRSLEADVAKHFRCSKCGMRRPSLRPTIEAPTLTDFFPVTEGAWQKLARRARG